MDEVTIIKTYSDGINAVVSLVKDLNGQILVLTSQVDTLNKRITELEARLNKNSGNSDKPPSSCSCKLGIFDFSNSGDAGMVSLIL